jgi:Predicted ATPase (AAA+ superfamily)
MTEPSLLPLLRQIAAALERLAPADPPSAPLDSAEAFIWHAEGSRLEAVDRVSRSSSSCCAGSIATATS